MNGSRFQVLGVEHRGYPIARIHDHRENCDQLIYHKLGKLRHWNRGDEPVTNRTLRRVAREALRGVETEREVFQQQREALKRRQRDSEIEHHAAEVSRWN